MKNLALTEMLAGMQFLLCTLAVWRLTHLFVLEDGPWDFVYHLRKKLGNSIFGQAMDCFYCLSLWIAVPFAFVIFHDWIGRVICWLALSGAACLLEQFTGRLNHGNENKSE